MTVLDEFYKVGPGPSSSHTIGPMRITYDFYQRCTKLPADQLAKATGLKVHLYGSLSATGKGHGTERASLAGLIGKEPATVDPLFLDEMKEKPDANVSAEARRQDVQPVAGRHHLRLAQGRIPAPEHDDLQTHGRRQGDCWSRSITRPAAGSMSGRATRRRRRAQPKYPYATMKELRQHAEKNKLSIAQVIMANEVAVSGKTEEQINAFLDKITAAMLATVKAGLAVKEGVLPGPIKLQSKAATVFERAQDDKYESDRAIAQVSAFALAASEENARGHLVITAPTGGSAGVMPAIVYALTESKRKLSKEKAREGLLAGAAIGYLCKHNATLSGAEGGCQSEIGVASAMTAAFIAQVMDSSPLVIENAAESALEHHLGHDLRSGRGLRAGALHRALRVRRGESLDRLHDRDQRDRVAAPRGSRHHDHNPGPNGQGHGQRSTRKPAKPGWPRTWFFAETIVKDTHMSSDCCRTAKRAPSHGARRNKQRQTGERRLARIQTRPVAARRQRALVPSAELHTVRR